MNKHDFHYDLPAELIAQQPQPERSMSRLLHLDGDSGELADRQFQDVLELVRPGDLMVFNDTRVIPARVFATKESGGRLEILVERVLSETKLLAHIRASKPPKPGAYIILANGVRAQMVERRESLFLLSFSDDVNVLKLLDQIGHIPLPPYIERADELEDRERYQTVYGSKLGAVAAPTAGLHFDQTILDKLQQKGVNTAYVTLHVGAGTFQPVRCDDIRDHVMHSELMSLDASTCAAIQETKDRGGRVIAVGTTSVRCLETAASAEGLAPYQGETNIFIYPGYRYKLVDCLITNFHLPESTLIMLVSAFAGHGRTMTAYRHAVAQKYRFFSYGDAMFIEKNHHASQEFNPRVDAPGVDTP